MTGIDHDAAMHTPPTPDALLADAERLYASGRQVEAADKLVPLICAQGDPNIREQATALLALCTNDMTAEAVARAGVRGEPDSASSAPAAPSTPTHPLSTPRPPDGSNPQLAFSTCSSPGHGTRTETKQPPSILPSQASHLHKSFVTHLCTYLRISHGEGFRLPDEFAMLVNDIKRQVDRLPNASTQNDVYELLKTARANFPDLAMHLGIFSALVTIFYVNDYLSRDQTRWLLEDSCVAIPEHSLSELLAGDE
jgi:hypothetical protein